MSSRVSLRRVEKLFALEVIFWQGFICTFLLTDLRRHLIKSMVCQEQADCREKGECVCAYLSRQCCSPDSATPPALIPLLFLIMTTLKTTTTPPKKMKKKAGNDPKSWNRFSGLCRNMQEMFCARWSVVLGCSTEGHWVCLFSASLHKWCVWFFSCS